MVEATTLSVTWHDPNLRPDCAQEVERWLAAEGLRIDLQVEYPHAFHLEGRSQVASIACDGRLVTHAVTREVTAVTRDGPASFTLVGAVATHPEHRRRGLATRLVQEIVQRAQCRGQDAVCLWSERWGFYERLGFEPAGAQSELVVGPARGSLATGIRPAEARDVVALWELHGRKPWRIDRSVTDMALLLSIPKMRTLVLERRGRPVAYACLGKGADFTNWWHEQGGSDEDVATLVRGATEFLGLEEATVLVPPYRATLRAMLAPTQRKVREGVCALRLALSDAGRSDFFIDGLDSL